VQPLWKTVWKFFKKLKIELPYDPAITLLGIYPKNAKTLIQRDTCTLCLLQHYLQYPCYKSSPSVHQLMNGLKKIGIYAHDEILLSHKKEGNLAICKDMDRARQYSAK